MPPEERKLVLGQSRAEGRDRVGEAGDAQGDDVDIALDGDHRAALVGGLAGEMVVVKEPALVEERRIRRVQVLCRNLGAHGPPAEGDDAAAQVADREHDPVAETVVGDLDVLAGDEEAQPPPSSRAATSLPAR